MTGCAPYAVRPRRCSRRNREEGAGTSRVVIVGAGAAGVSAAEAARLENGHAEITVLGAESYLPYHRPRLTYVLGKSARVETFLLHPREWYAERRIDLRTGCRVLAGDQNFVTDEGDNIYRFDSLVLTTGGTSAIPPTPGKDLKGVFALRTYDDLLAIEEYARDESAVAIIGGGLLGLEAAWSFRQWGKQVYVLDRGTGLLKNQLDDEGMKTIGRIVESAGVRTVYEADTQEIAGTGHADGVNLKDGRKIEAGVVLLSTGVRSETGLARALGLKTNRGVIVDDRMSAAPGVYAAGDAAEHAGKVMGIWPVAVAQGKVAGINAVGGSAVYEPLVPSNTTMVMGTTVFSAGDIGRGTGPYRTLEWDDGQKDYVKFYIEQPKLAGAILIGQTRKALKVKALIDSAAELPAALAAAGDARAFLEAV